MFRKILSILVAIFMFLPNIARGAEMVNVEYVHQYLNTRWGIDLPYNPELKNPRVAANMKYLLTVIDIANEFFNDEQTTDYGNGEYATLAAADTVATNTAIDTLINAPTFTITTTPNTSSFNMIIGAAGNFIIDWGDGEFETIKDKPIGTAKLDMDTGANWVPAFALTNALDGSIIATNVAKISGGLGRVFPTMDDGSNPNFIYTFVMAPITEIPADLFDGISGTPTHAMFLNTFADTAITSIPADLFAGVQGAPAVGMFLGTFANTAITSIPADLFAGIRGAPAEYMFRSTFSDTALTEIPADLFAGIRGAPADYMFSSTFSNTDITSVPANLFGTLNGDGAQYMFFMTFYNCDNLTTIEGPLFSGTITPADYMFSSTFSSTNITSVPANLFGTLNGDGAAYMFDYTFFGCNNLTTIDGPLFSGTITPAKYMFFETFSGSGITSMPANLFTGVQGAPAGHMFNGTFHNCANLQSIPSDLFAGISGAPADYMFSTTFSGCSELQSIPENLFAGISGPAADYMFNRTFSSCTSLTGPSARTNGQYLYEIWPDITSDMNTYFGSRHLDDYDQIPDKWK